MMEQNNLKFVKNNIKNLKVGGNMSKSKMLLIISFIVLIISSNFVAQIQAESIDDNKIDNSIAMYIGRPQHLLIIIEKIMNPIMINVVPVIKKIGYLFQSDS